MPKHYVRGTRQRFQNGLMKIFIEEKSYLGYPHSPLRGYSWLSMFPIHTQHSSSAVTGYRIRGIGLR